MYQLRLSVLKQKGFAPILILLILAILVVGAYLINKNFCLLRKVPCTQTLPPYSQTPIPLADSIGDWKTYTNTKYDYQFQYAPDFKITADSDDHVLIDNSLPPDPSCKTGGCFLGTQNLKIFFEHLGNIGEDSMSLDDYATKQRNVALNFGNAQSKIIQITKFGTDVRFFEGGTEGYNHNYLFRIKDKNFSITVVFPGKDDVQKFEKLENQILSTFKFNDDSGNNLKWETTQFGIEFNYPSTYVNQDTGGGAKNYLGNEVIAYFIKFNSQQTGYDTDKLFELTYDDRQKFSLNYLHKYAPTGAEELDPKQVNFGANKFYYYGFAGGDVCYPDQFFYNSNGRIFIFRFNGCENNKQPAGDVKKVEDVVLSSFKINK